MPKLDPTHIAERLQHRIKQLEAGEEVAVKEINSLLTVGQRKAFDDAWQAQSKLRKKKRARNEAEQKALGWKTKREVRLEVLRQALEEVSGNMLKSLRELQQKAEIRGARIFLDNYFNAMEQKKTEDEALTRA
jgi:hypothetical protein